MLLYFLYISNEIYPPGGGLSPGILASLIVLLENSTTNRAVGGVYLNPVPFLTNQIEPAGGAFAPAIACDSNFKFVKTPLLAKIVTNLRIRYG